MNVTRTFLRFYSIPAEWSHTMRLSKNPKLQDSYRNFYGGIRFGRLLEDLDAFAGLVAYKFATPEVESFAFEEFVVRSSDSRLIEHSRQSLSLFLS